MTLRVDALMRRAAAEEELLEIGYQFTQALQSYAAVTPRGQPQQPPSLKELLLDPRFPQVRRHLRKIFVDPVTGKAEWGVMYLTEKKGVVGVYSLSDEPPLKVGNFDARFAGFDNKEKISDWRFTYTGQAMGTNAVPSDMTPPPIPVIVPTTPIEPPKEGEPADPGTSKPGGTPPVGGGAARPGSGTPPPQPPPPPQQPDNTPPPEPPATEPSEPPPPKPEDKPAPQEPSPMTGGDTVPPPKQ
jgi:hypothetical protein